jgi:hypothetical protein
MGVRNRDPEYEPSDGTATASAHEHTVIKNIKQDQTFKTNE